MSPGTGYIDMMKGFEGDVLHPYPDSAGIPTIGIGSTTYIGGSHVTLNDPPITESQAVDILLHLSMPNQRLLNSLFADGKLKQQQNDALLSLIYRIGAPHFQTSTVLRLALVNPDDPNIKAAWCLWDKIHKDGQLIFDQGELNRCLADYKVYSS